MKKKLVVGMVVVGLIVAALGFGTVAKEVEEGQKVAYIGHGA